MRVPLRSSPWSALVFALTRKSPHQEKAEKVSSKRSRATRDPLEAISQAKHLLTISGVDQCTIVYLNASNILCILINLSLASPPSSILPPPTPPLSPLSLSPRRVGPREGIASGARTPKGFSRFVVWGLGFTKGSRTEPGHRAARLGSGFRVWG